jgi:diadenosine tetraphosphatase ApaH/serine/threonine PP2A family protein phosphatase
MPAVQEGTGARACNTSRAGGGSGGAGRAPSRCNIPTGLQRAHTSRTRASSHPSPSPKVLTDLFDNLPLAAVIENQLFCPHAGASSGMLAALQRGPAAGEAGCSRS